MTLLEQIRAEGYALMRLSPADTGRLEAVYREATAFFGREPAEKLRHGFPGRNNGYRPIGYAHSGSAQTPDTNDSFLYWPDRRGQFTEPQPPIDGFLDALEAYRQIAARITTDLIAELSAHYGHRSALAFEQASVLQVNAFGEPSDRELLQYPHEDAVLITVINTNAKGLELLVDGERGGTLLPCAFAPDEVMVMPGSVLTDMTGGEIKPLFHQARNHGTPERKSVMYFVSPDVAEPIEPFLANDYNRDFDIRARVISNPQQFGLSPDFVTE